MSLPVITDAHLHALERPPAAVWDRMSRYARSRWERRHRAALRTQSQAEPAPEPLAVDLAERVTAYLEAVTDHPRPLSIRQAARDLGLTDKRLIGALTRLGRQDLLDRLRRPRRAPGGATLVGGVVAR